MTFYDAAADRRLLPHFMDEWDANCKPPYVHSRRILVWRGRTLWSGRWGHTYIGPGPRDEEDNG